MNYTLPPDEGKKKKNLYWNTCIALAVLAFIMFMVSATTGMDEPRGEYVTNGAGDSMYKCADGERLFDPEEVLENNGARDCGDGSDEDEMGAGEGIAQTCGAIMCCCSLIFAISALSTKNDTQRIVVVQQQPQYVPVIQPQYIPVPQQVRVPIAPPLAQQAIPSASTGAVKTKQMWAAEAQNLVLARNWEGAAEAYQKAGMFSEAGQIRQAHLEKSQPMVQIGQVGNTVLNDSVMIADNTPKSCAGCGITADPSWKICPHCSTHL